MKKPPTIPRPFHVYIVRCTNGHLYTGVTTDVQRRVLQHNSSKGGARYTRAFGPVKLVWTQPQPDYSSALKREAEIKKWPRLKKLTLLKSGRRPA